MSSSLWFTRQAEGFRAWFAPETATGKLKPGMVAGDFTVTVIDPTDTNTSTPAVSESSAKAGLYTFVIPNSFLTANGNGVYGVVVEVDTKAGPSASPHIVAIMDAHLRVTLEDLDVSASQILALYRILGLDPAHPLVVSSTSRTAGTAITQTIGIVGDVVTVTRIP